MSIDASIPLQGVSPVKTFSDLANAQALQAQAGYHMQQTQLAQQQTQQAALANQQQAQQIADQQTIQQHMADPQNARAIGAGDFSKLAGKVLPGTMFGLQKTIMDAQEAAQNLDKTKLANYATRHGEFANTIDGLMALPQDQRQQAYTQAISSLAANGHTQGIDLPQTIDVSDEGLKKLGAINGVYAGLYDKALTRQKEQAAAAKDVSQGKEFEASAASKTAGIPALEAEGTIKQAQADNMTPEGLLPKEAAKQQQAADALKQAQLHFQETSAETKRHNLTSESTNKLNAAIAAGHLAQTQLVNGMKYGPDTVGYWVQQIHQSPDSIKEMPPELRTKVGQEFTAKTGLPLPTPASAPAQASEMAARNALDGADFIKRALQNPAIKANIGPILGRLGEAEQGLGASLHLSPADEALAQELRTRMKYFVFQEGKAVLGGRLPQQLMQQLESSSPNVKMDAGTLTGALNGAAGNARGVIDNVERSRFGGQVRSDSARHLPGSTVTLMAPNGQRLTLPAGDPQIEHYKSLGAKVE